MLDAPPGYARTLGALPDGLVLGDAVDADMDWIQLFTRSRADLEAALPGLRQAILPAGKLWVSWPKGASEVATDVTEDVVRELAQRHGLVDVKVCSVDSTWSGLKLVVRVADR